MENLTHSRNPNRSSSLPKKPYNVNNNAEGFNYSSGKLTNTTTTTTTTTYDDVFGGPSRFGAPTLSPRLEDYSEIFAGFNGSSRAAVSSIPVLDLPLVDDREIYFDVRSQGFDYLEVFGGFNDLDFAPSYEDLFLQQRSTVVGDGDSSDDAWTPEEVESCSGGTEHSGKSPCFSNGRDSYDSIYGSTEFNISYNKANQITGGHKTMSSGVIHVADLGAIPAHTVAVDEMICAGETTKLKEPGPSSTGRGISRFAFEDKYYSSEPFVTVSEIGLKTHPTDIPPPSRPPPVLKSRFRSSASNSRTSGSEGSVDSSSPPFFDVEVDANSATEREAVIKAEAKSENAKELFERKRDGAWTITKPTSIENRMTEEDRSSHTAGFPVFRNNVDVTKKSLRIKSVSKSLSSQGSANSDGNDELEEPNQFVELVRTQLPRNADENSGEKYVSSPSNAEFFDQELTWAANVDWEKQRRRAKGDRGDYESRKMSKHPGTRKVSSRHKRHDNKLTEKATEELKNGKTRHVELRFEMGNNLPDHGGIVKHRNLLMSEENKRFTEKNANQRKELHCEETTKRRQNQQLDRKPHHKAAEKNQECVFEWEQNARKLREALGNESMLQVSLDLNANGKKLGMLGKSETKLNEALKRMEEETSVKEALVREENDRREREAFEKAENEKKLKAALEQEEKMKKVKEAREKEEKELRAAEAREKAEQERKMKEQQELELRLREASEREEMNRRMREAREKVEQERKMKEQQELESRLREDFEREKMNRRMREAREKAEHERKMKVALEQEKERRIKEALEKKENEQRVKEALEKAELEQRLKETLEKEEKERQVKEFQKREENERKAKEVLEQAENERKLKEAFEQKEKERRVKEAREKEENERKLKEAAEQKEKERKLKEAREQEENEKKRKEAMELEEKEKRLIEAFERAETERRLKEDLEQEEMRMNLQEAEERERTHRENQEHQENEIKQQHEYSREESDEEERDACEMENTCETTIETHGNQSSDESFSDPLEEAESIDNHKSVTIQKEEDGPSLRESMCEETCPWKVFEKNLKDASQKEGTSELNAESTLFERSNEATHLGENGGYSLQNGESGEECTSNTENIRGKHGQQSNNSETSKDASVLKQDNGLKTEVEEKSEDDVGEVENVRKAVGVGCDKRNPEVSECAPKTSSALRNHEKKSTHQQERGSIYEIQEGLNKDTILERPFPSRVFMQREREVERLKRERDFEMERLRKIEEEREREREREKDRMAFDQRALADARERLEKACADAREKSFPDKLSVEARLRAERAAVERATAEARERAAEKAAFEARERMERSVSDKQSHNSGFFGERSVSDKQFQNSLSFGAARYQNSPDGESPQRYTSRLERHRRTADRVAKALAEKNMRDLVAQREQAERIRISETLDADVKRWSNGKEGNIRALLSTLQYILGPESGWQPIPLTEVITSAAVKRAYRKATLCVHPDKLQQRGANIHQKYICEKVFDLLKEAWHRFNSEER